MLTEHYTMRSVTTKERVVLNTKLKTKRHEAGLTQVEVAKKARITEVSYQRIEYGVQNPSLKTAILIAKALNSTVEELFRESITQP